MLEENQPQQSQILISEQRLRTMIRDEVARQNRKMFWRRLPSWGIAMLSWIERIIELHH